MITQKNEYKKLISHRLDENVKSFKILFNIKHYGNCISIVCQELDQVIRLLYLLNRNPIEQEQFMDSSNNSHRWFVMRNSKKEYITDKDIEEYSVSLNGWDKSIYEFGIAFESLSNDFNYGTKDPIKSMNDVDRNKLFNYIVEYHKSNFPKEFSMDDLIPILPEIIEKISEKLTVYLERI